MDTLCLINWKENTGSNLGVQNGKLTTLKARSWHPAQSWIRKVLAWDNIYHDSADKIDAFLLINKETGEALGARENEVAMAPYDPSKADESLLWTKSPQAGEQWGMLRPYKNSKLSVEDAEDTIILSADSNVADSRLWKLITPEIPGPFYTIHVEQGNGAYCLAQRGQNAISALYNKLNDSQLWIKVDEEFWDGESAAFSLINKASLKALKHSKENSQIVTANYVIDDTSFMWTKRVDGYDMIRSMENRNLVVDVRGGTVSDGVSIILYRAKGEGNQLWKFVSE